MKTICPAPRFSASAKLRSDWCAATPSDALTFARKTRGSALVITLAFVVLLTGVVVAFFTRSISARQMSNSNVNVTRSSLFAQGAAETIIGDLKQEIVAGSTAVTPSGSTTTIYLPKPPATGGIDGTVMPAQVGTPSIYVDANNVDYPNLLKRSVYGSNPKTNLANSFYPANSNYAPPTSGSNRASNLSTLTASQNGRAVSPARWNAPLLLPKLATSSNSSVAADDITPLGAKPATANAVASWTYAPDWILVSRNGNNPILANTSLPTSTTTPYKWTSANENTVVGRYAYMIYHEGGLLDMNAAGYPYASGTSSPPAPTSYLNYPAYKSSLTFADLSVLKGATGTAYLSKDQIEQYAAWRNMASSGIASGSLPGIAWTAPAKQSFYTGFGFGNLKGYLSTINTGVSGTNQTDHLITSRQSLIQMMTRTLASLNSDLTSLSTHPDINERAAAQNVLQYLGTFSRDLNQPSYIPASALVPPPSGLPTVKDPATGAGNDGYQGDKAINPSFLSIRATSAFNRIDGTKAVVGEPLVKTRFSLSRLAWLTLKGPIAPDGTLSSDGNVTPAIADLRKRGFGDDFLKRGTTANVKQYFGLSWDDTKNRWSYQDSTIKTLSQVATLNREANFVELVKAAVNVGAIAKPSIQKPGSGGNTVTNAFDPLNWQFQRDYSVDRAVLQIVANIIDQFDTDGYPTRILLAGDAPSKEIAGVENIPYLYKMRDGVLKLREANPAPTGDAFADTNNNSAPQGPLKDAGVGALMLMPEIWNPHSASTIAYLGSPRPQDFRVVVDSADPDSIDPAGSSTTTYNSIKVVGWKNTAQFWTDQAAKVPPSGINWTRAADGGGAIFTDGYTGHARKLSVANSLMTFSVTDVNAFREPTVLFKPGQPAGTNLAMGIAAIQQSDAPFYADLAPFLGTKGFKSVGDTNPGREPSAPAAGQEYAGICVGLFPLRFIGASNRVYTVKWPSTVVGGSRTGKLSSPDAFFTYRLQFKDVNGNWQDYDKKYTQLYADQLEVPYSGVTTPGNWTKSGGLISPFAQITGYIDPRTSRFGPVVGSWAPKTGYEAPGAAAVDWIDSTQGYVVSDRPDGSAGFSPNYSSAPDWEARKAAGWVNTGALRRGMFSQNLMTLNGNVVNDDGKRYSGDSAAQDAGSSQYYSDADGVVRRAMGGNVPPGAAPAATTVGLPMAKLGTSTAAQKQQESRPMILNRPFQSVAELSYVFSGTPWKNLDFSSPDSGFSPLLDVFCLNEGGDSSGMVAGKVNLNTRQAPVLQAVLAGGYIKDESFATSSLAAGDNSVSDKLAQALVKRTKSSVSPAGTSTPPSGALMNISELVGKYAPNGSSSSPLDGDKTYDGFAKDLTALFGTNGTSPDPDMNNVARFRESAIRPLAAAGQTRVWNLMIDVIAQTGRYPTSATSTKAFVVEGERRLWVHVAIDRLTGDIIDKQIEVVDE